ncbi:shikimate kinase [Campylobacter upsaliensis]|uniref:shikimate kinase n=1 Tax=Campylobacter upsaliensis TaxID=28080 RepID=UPI00128944BF|nr:shikimate kinase [Campylobacter upsaliensis]EAH7597867.1 shikimate kinase [Campylobacter upsaliensis]EAJ2427835.1 shikimate kinase [Campylobacter upsaliensis]EAJ7018577.1 shikimate kinase [Campylobacter upsaliensis]EAJ7390407.1 shikimate kinase [Campylobacter upsaliensis]EAJ7577312.1 shikimate kinase [Campylobacter upsaliensis]
MEKIENILFIGFMGCGKSTLAREFARESERVFIDSDALIEMQFDLSVNEIFAKFGEEFFRKEEQKMANFLTHTRGISLATGGGFVGVRNLDKIGFCVYLRASFEFLKERLGKKEKAKRPLFLDEEKAKKLYHTRLSLYEEKANLILDIENQSLESLIKELKKRIK